ncbi:MAG: hypothetical protein F4X36_10495 [Gammaproteobacteria bacterium]|nr:hypothetical protein [Gammaproteobacteria bacterium]
MSEPTRPLPRLDEPDTADFWAGTRKRELRYQRCEDTGTVIWHPRAHSPGSLDGRLSTHVASGRGTVYSYSIVRHLYHPSFRAGGPSVGAWGALD